MRTGRRMRLTARYLRAAVALAALAGCGGSVLRAQTGVAAPQKVSVFAGTPTAPQATVTVTPVNPAVAPGASLKFSAAVTGSANTSVVWTATGGTISSDGTFVAGQSTGTFVVVATLRGGSIAGSTNVRVQTSTDPSPSVRVSPGQSIQAVVNAAPDGAVIALAAGVHRMQTVSPKNNQTITGDPGAILSGARVLTGWTQDGSRWYVGGQTQQGGPVLPPTTGGFRVCQAGHDRCAYPEDVFMDNVRKKHVAALGQVVAGTWFFDYGADRIYVGDNPAGKLVETSVTAVAFGGSASGVTIRNLIIEKFASPAQRGAIQGGANWTIRDSEIRWNHGIGVGMASTRKVLGNKIHHQGQLGIGGTGNGSLVEGNEISYNNTASFEPTFEAGASKFTFTDGLMVRNNWVHHNFGLGLWTDIDNLNIVYEHNTVEDNEWAGITHEISYNAIIRFNTSRRNGTVKPYPFWVEGSCIAVSNSSDVEVYGNTCVDNWQGIVGMQTQRGTGAHGPWILRNLHVHDNSVTQRAALGAGSGRTGIMQPDGGTEAFTSLNNRFTGNDYVLGTASQYFTWMNGERTEAQWRSYGQDVDGTFTR
jgi:hypothetical protein